MKPQHGRRRVVIEDVNPQIDGGRHAIHRIAGDEVFVTAAIYADGKDELAARLLYRHSSDAQWRFVPMHATGNDLWSGGVSRGQAWRLALHSSGVGGPFCELGRRSEETHRGAERPVAGRSNFDACGRRRDSRPNSGAGLDVGSNPAVQDIALALCSGAALVRGASRRARGSDAKKLQQWAQKLERLAQEKRTIYDDPCDASLIRIDGA